MVGVAGLSFTNPTVKKGRNLLMKKIGMSLLAVAFCAVALDRKSVV
jgi:hypothetical protein